MGHAISYGEPPRRLGRPWWAAVAVLGAACAGPTLTVHPPESGELFVDGMRDPGTARPIPYYGTMALAVQPTIAAEPDFARIGNRTQLELAAPVSPWLYPLDFPLACVQALFGGTHDVVAQIELRQNPADVAPGYHPPAQSEVERRARAARTQR